MTRQTRMKQAEEAFAIAYTDMVERGSRLEWHGHGEWLTRFHKRFGGEVR